MSPKTTLPAVNAWTFSAEEADAMREWVAFVKKNQAGKVLLPSSDGARSRQSRLMTRAYADVYGLDLIDEDETQFAHALRSHELACLPRLRHQIRAYHKDAPWIPASIKRGIAFSVRLMTQRVLPLAGAVTAFGVLLLVLYSIGFTDEPVIHTNGQTIAGVAFLVLVAVAGFGGLVVALFVLVMALNALTGGLLGDGGPNAAPARRVYPRKSDTTYGDARAADDWEIDEALRDRTGGFNPIFKD